MEGARETVVALKEQGAENLIGTFCASWDDAGLHDEVFWLGWTAVTQYGWTDTRPSAEQTVADFLATDSTLERVIFACFDDSVQQAFDTALQRLKG